MFFKKKNKVNKHIIVYHYNDEESVEMANLLILKGYQNIVLLTGGLKKFTSLYPELIEGENIPIIKKEKKSFLKRKSYFCL